MLRSDKLPSQPQPENTIRWPNVALILDHRLRRWANIKATLGQRLVFSD